MKKYFIILLFLAFQSSAQNKLFQNLTDREFTKKIREYYHIEIENLPEKEAEKAFLQLEQKIGAKKDNFKAVTTQFLRAHFCVFMQKCTKINLFEEVLFKAKKLQYNDLYAECLGVLGNIEFEKENYNKAFEYFLEVDKLQKQTNEKFSYVDNIFYNIGVCYYRFHDYTMALYFMNKAQSLSLDVNSYNQYHIYNTTGMIYRNQNKLDSALIFFNKALAQGKASKRNERIGLASGNIGIVYFMQGKINKAKPLLELDLLESKRTHDKSNTANNLAYLCKIAIKQNDIVFVKKNLPQLFQIADSVNAPELKKGYFEVLRGLYLYQKNSDLALKATDSLALYTQKINDKIDRQILKQLEIKQQAQNFELESKLIVSEKNRLKSIRNYLIISLILVLGIGLLVFFLQKINQKAIFEANFQKQKLLEFEKEKAAKQLLDAQNQLLEYTDILKDKMNLIDDFKTKIAIIEAKETKTEHQETLAFLSKSLLLTEQEWLNFRKKFEQVYPSFFVDLFENLPEITQAEIRFLALSKLNLNHKEMALMLGVSPESITKIKYRLRKKLDEQQLENFENLL